MQRTPSLALWTVALLACAGAPRAAMPPSGATTASSGNTATAAGELPIGAAAPEFGSLEASRWLNGSPTSLASLHGQVVLVESWHWLCDGCRESVPVVRTLADRFAGRGLHVVSTHAARPDPSPQELEAIQNAVHEEHMTYPCFLDPGSAWSRQLGLSLRPSFLVIGRDGRVAYRVAAVMTEGESDAQALTAAVEHALSVPVP